MREIKFRAKQGYGSGKGKWWYGYFSKDYTGFAYITTLDGVDTVIVDESTVGQFTGLRDKNGVELFEGDNYKLPGNDHVYTVVFFDGAFYGKYINSHHRLSATLGCIEIIGNIHETP